MKRYLTIFGLLAALVTGCSAAHASSAPQTGTSAANALVCQHYLKQRAWVKNLVQPTLADAFQFETDVAADQTESTGKLHQDLTAMANAQSQSKGTAAEVYAASTRVYEDCT